MKDIDSIRQFLKQASAVEVFLVSFFLLPFVFNAWVTVFIKVKVSPEIIKLSLWIIACLYILCVVLLIWGTFKGRKRELVKNQILSYLDSTNRNMVSFDRIRAKFSQSYDDKFLESLIYAFPNDIRLGKFKGGSKGIARIVEETEVDE